MEKIFSKIKYTSTLMKHNFFQKKIEFESVFFNSNYFTFEFNKRFEFDFFFIFFRHALYLLKYV